MASATLHAPQAAGSSKVTDSQVAFMVECYLRDSHFSRTLTEFRSEAARLLHPLRSVPKGARSLSAVLNDYVALKEEQISATAEKARVEDLFNGLQEILSVYLAGAPKKNATMAELGNGRIASTFSPPPHVMPPATVMQQPQLRGSSISEAGNAFTSADHNSKQKPSSSKRKSLDNTSVDNLQQGDSTIDAAKKSRRGSNIKRSSTDPPLTGSSVDVDSPTGSTGNMVNKMVQPVTPPMSMINSSKQQQALPSLAASGSPQPSALPTANRSSLVFPRHESKTTTPPPSLRGDCSQSHQDPQTPPPSSVKSSLTNSSMSAPIAANVKRDIGTTTVQQEKPNTCPYALRAHRKPGSDPPNAGHSDVKLNCAQKATRKKANNSKCRLLDFSLAAEEVTKDVSPFNQGNEVVSSSDCGDILTNSQQTCGSSAECPIKLQSEHVSDLPSSNQDSQESQASEFSLPCDTFSFDELFDLDLDTSLISELEDLGAFTGSDEGPSCLKTSDMGALPLAPEPSTRGILTDVGNFIHPDDATSLGPQCANSLASPSKPRKPVGSESNKENMHVAVVSSPL